MMQNIEKMTNFRWFLDTWKFLIYEWKSFNANKDRKKGFLRWLLAKTARGKCVYYDFR